MLSTTKYPLIEPKSKGETVPLNLHTSIFENQSPVTLTAADQALLQEHRVVINNQLTNRVMRLHDSRIHVPGMRYDHQLPVIISPILNLGSSSYTAAEGLV